ncbi:helix-turn-helix domain-containing protein [Duganella levis]|uniref:Helix-turn-helix domain-containing protein n=1 Tax=Duganella levis TaxID=2692169 RepID=A0ABW9W7G0_9BURK|nr:helix-turn-helix domain-containing protein [Duganella levis]MYN30022.1 helix-turn-helix domain-containing protein [Duganella levis]
MMQSQPQGGRRAIGMIDMLQLSTPQPAWPPDAGTFLLAIQRRGASKVHQHGRTAQLGPGDMALYAAADDYRVAWQAASEQLLLVLPAAPLRSACPELDQLTAVTLKHGQPMVALLGIMADSHFHAVQELPPPAAAHAAHALIATLAGCLLTLDNPAPTERSRLSQYHLQRIRQYALANLADTELSVARVGAALGMSAAHIHRLFADEAQTFAAWLWESRLRACQQALRQSSARLSISAIAFQNGFAHATHFSRAFRARFGMTASAWRNSAGA